MAVDERGYPVVDLSVLREPGKEFAVRCYTRDEAKHFLSTMLHQYPHATKSWGWPNICWDDNAVRDHTDYYPDINKTDGEYAYMSWDASGWAESHPETIVIDFADLINGWNPFDLGELEDFSEDINDLFGML